MVSSSNIRAGGVASPTPSDPDIHDGALNAESALPDISGLSIADPTPRHRHHFPASPPTTPTRDNRHRRRPPTPHTVVNITVNATTAPVTVHTGDSGNSPSGNTRRRGILVERSPSPSARTASSRTSLADSSIPADRPSYLHPSAYVETTPTPPQSPRRSRTGYVLDEEAKAHRLAVIEETLREVRAEREEEMRRSQYALPAARASPSKSGPQPSDKGIPAEREEQTRRPQRAAAPPAARTSARKPDPQPSDEGIHPEDEHIEQYDSRHRGRWYVVIAGLKVGIWKRYTDITPYVVGVSHALHQSCKTWKEAKETYDELKEGGVVTVLSA